MTSCMEKIEKAPRQSDRDDEKAIEEFKPKMRDAIIKSVSYVKEGFFSGKSSIEDIIDEIMDTPELYSYLFTVIVNHSLGVKKNFSRQFKLTQTTQRLFT